MSIIEHAKYYEGKAQNFSHVHTSCEFIYVISGRVNVNDGRQSVDLADNDCLLIKSRQFHNVTVSNEIEYKRFIAFINPWELRTQLVRPDLFAVLTDISKSGMIYLHNVPKLYDGFQRVTEIFEQGGNIYKELGAALDMLSMFYEEVRPRSSYAVENSSKLLTDKVRAYIEQNYADNIRIGQIADKNFVSVGYLTHAFTAETGISPRKYLSHIRCTRAFELICHTNMAFADISRNTGFCSATDMSKCIREYYGKTPTSLRRETNRSDHNMKG